MNGLVSGYGSDSEEEDPTARPSCLGPTPRKDNGAVKSGPVKSGPVKSTEKGLLLVDISYVTFTKKKDHWQVTHFLSLNDRFFCLLPAFVGHYLRIE